MKKKVGIITFHLATNYGAVLQCYALQEFLKSHGCNAMVIDYHPDFKKRRESIINRNPILNCARKIYVQLRDLTPSRILWTLSFKKFVRTKLCLSKKCNERTIPSTFDVYIIGSDQLWNYSITGGPHGIYFADFPFDKGKRKYLSYAVSMELHTIPEEDKVKTRHLLENFDCISVREQNTQSFLQQLASKRIEKTIDPTLLVNRAVWDDIQIAPNYKKKYILVYQVRKTPHAMKVAESLAKQMDAEIVEIASGLNDSNDGAIRHTSPERFVGWFKNATAVVTTSFHGTAFSLIYNKPFYSISIGDGWDNRVSSLLQELGLADRQIRTGEIPDFSEVNYSAVNEKLDALKRKSANFLLNNI